MLRLSSYLVSKFLKSKQNSPLLHYQILSILFFNFALIFLIFSLETFTSFYKGSDYQASYFFTITSVLASGFSISSLYKGDHQTSGTIVLIYGHIMINLAAYILKAPLAGILAIFCFLNLSYILTESSFAKTSNHIASFLGLLIQSSELFKMFKVTLTEDQSFQIQSAVTILFIIFVYLIAYSSILTNIQKSLGKMAQDSLTKSENLTKDLVKTVEEKDNFTSFLSLEVKSVLSSLNGNLDNLFTSIKDQAQLQILKNAKISAEVLLNLVKNTLDAVNIKTDKLELSYDNANLQDLIKKTFIIHSENLKAKDIFAQALIDTNIPENLWIDTGRLLQILINLVSNALKFTPNHGRINIHATWCESEGETEALKPKHLTKLIKNYKPVTIQQQHQKSKIPYYPSSGSPLTTQNDTERSFVSSENFLEFGYEQETNHFKNLMTFEKYSSINFRGSQNLLVLPENWSIKRTEFIKPPSQENISSQNKTGYLKIQVSDNGCGISQQDIPHLFEMRNSTQRGLGLWICKQLCQKMNGDIVISSQVNKGTDFMFYIYVDNSKRKEVVSPIQAPSLDQREQIRALVVDDYEFNRNLHKLLLEREGVQVTLANDGIEAVNKYKEKGNGYFDFIFMDINMPKMDGISAVKEIRKLEEEKGLEKVDVHFISGDYFPEGEIFKRVGSSEQIRFIRKPIEVGSVAKIVEDIGNKFL